MILGFITAEETTYYLERKQWIHSAIEREFFFPTRVNNTSHPKSPNRPDGYDQPQDDQRVLRDYWSL